MTSKIKVAVVVGRHAYDVQSFQKAFTDNADFEVYIQCLELFTCSPKEQRESYDAVVFYNCHAETPPPESEWNERTALEQLGDTAQGIMILHHAFIAYHSWPLWAEISGLALTHFSYHQDEEVEYRILKDHAITAKSNAFRMIDETFVMNEPDEDSEVLVATNHSPSMRAILWTRKFRNSRVVCYQSGHGAAAYTDKNFRSLLRESILWLAEKKEGFD